MPVSLSVLMHKGEFNMSNFTLHQPDEASPESITTTPPADFTRQEVLAATTLALERAEQLAEGDVARAGFLASHIDLTDSLSITRYGEKVQRQITSLTDETLHSVLRRDTREIGILLQDATRQIQALTSATPTTRRGLLGFLRSPWHSTNLSADYAKVSKTIERNKRELDGWRMKLLVDLKTLDQMYTQLVGYHSKLVARIHAGERKLASFRTNELSWLRQQAVSTGSEEDALLYNDAANKCDHFANRLHDLALTKAISVQLASQIQLVISVNRQLTATILSSVVNAIAAWQLNVTAALASQEGLETFRRYSAQLLDSLAAASAAEKKGGQLKSEVTSDTESEVVSGTKQTKS